MRPLPPVRLAFSLRPVLAALALSMVVAPGWAQTVPAGQSCGGLLCDLGVFGHTTAAAPLAAAPVLAPARAPVATPGPAAADVAPAPRRVAAVRPRRHAARKVPRPQKLAAVPAPAPPLASAPARRLPPQPAASPAAPARMPFVFRSIDPTFIYGQ